MVSHEGHRTSSRGTILVGSDNGLFAQIVGAMVRERGFSVAYSAQLEPAWLSVTRTHPRILICSASGLVDGTRALMIAAGLRHIPVLLMDHRLERLAGHPSTLRQGVAWLALPATQEVFGAVLESLLAQSSRGSTRHEALAVGY